MAADYLVRGKTKKAGERRKEVKEIFQGRQWACWEGGEFRNRYPGKSGLGLAFGEKHNLVS